MPSATTDNTKSIAFFGATGGIGLAALQKAIAAGHRCVALCRKPEKMDAIFPGGLPPNLHIVQGNAHDAEAVARALVDPAEPSRTVDAVVSTIGGAFNASNFTIDDPHVCEKGVGALLGALEGLRRSGAAAGRPLLVMVSTTGISEHAKDVPLGMRPFYNHGLKVPHADKRQLEARLRASDERWVALRPSFLVDGAKPERKVRVGVEDPARGVERKEVGYFISREDAGRWMYENLVAADAAQYECKAVSITW